MKVTITLSKTPFEITFEWETASNATESQFDMECIRMIRKLQELGRMT